MKTGARAERAERAETTRSTKDRILVEAEKLFAAKGFAGTGIEEIARNAGIRKSVIYYHFKNKEQVLQTLLDNFVAEGVAFKKSLFVRYEKTLVNHLDEIMAMMVDFLESRRRIVTILLMESIKNPGEMPLLDIWNFQSSAAEEVVRSAKEHNIGTVKSLDRDVEAMHEIFFMLSLPIIGYTVFGDKWCEHMGFDKARSRDNFVDSFLWYFRERLLTRGGSQ
jgi:AcrR family transcriptional regulator